MSDNLQNSEITISNSDSEDKKISLKEFKSFYCRLNAKPDSDMKIYKEEKNIKLSNIVESFCHHSYSSISYIS